MRQMLLLINISKYHQQHVNITSRYFSTSLVFNGLRDKFINVKDLNKRPSELEIKKKNLPPNTPTLGQRIQRDRYSQFSEIYVKSGYFDGKTGTIRDYMADATLKDVILIGFRETVKQIKKWFQEIHEYDLDCIPRPGEKLTEWSFERESDLKNWIVTDDAHWGEGYSDASLSIGPTSKTALFSGNLSTRVPQDGRTQRSGYVNITSVKRLKSFQRVRILDWFFYTHLIMRIRGDGRTYTLNIHIDTFFDIAQHDLWHYPLYTRGGPYWQDVKIPFSKFLFGSRGSIQDKQRKLDLYACTGLGISLIDRTDGPFNLEISSIGVQFDPHTDTEEFAYETYKYPRPNYFDH